MVFRTAAAAAPGNWLEMQSHRPLLGSPISEILGVAPTSLCFDKSSKWFWECWSLRTTAIGQQNVSESIPLFWNYQSIRKRWVVTNRCFKRIVNVYLPGLHGVTCTDFMTFISSRLSAVFQNIYTYPAGKKLGNMK